MNTAGLSSFVRGALLGALFTVLVALAVPQPGNAQLGTEFGKCREQAWSDYNRCLMRNPHSAAHQAYCFFLWDLDNVGCDINLIKGLLGF